MRCSSEVALFACGNDGSSQTRHDSSTDGSGCRTRHTMEATPWKPHHGINTVAIWNLKHCTQRDCAKDGMPDCLEPSSYLHSFVVVLCRAAVGLHIVRRHLSKEHGWVTRVLVRMIHEPLFGVVLWAAHVTARLRPGRYLHSSSVQQSSEEANALAWCATFDRLWQCQEQDSVRYVTAWERTSAEQPGVMHCSLGSQSAHCALAYGGTL